MLLSLFICKTGQLRMQKLSWPQILLAGQIWDFIANLGETGHILHCPCNLGDNCICMQSEFPAIQYIPSTIEIEETLGVYFRLWSWLEKYIAFWNVFSTACHYCSQQSIGTYQTLDLGMYHGACASKQPRSLTGFAGTFMEARGRSASYCEQILITCCHLSVYWRHLWLTELLHKCIWWCAWEGVIWYIGEYDGGVCKEHALVC